MGVSKEQLEGVTVKCACGCGEEFKAFPLYDAGKGKGLRVPKYKRGHHPNCRTAQFHDTPWNKGLNRSANPSIGRQGRSGKQHWNYDDRQHPDWLSKDFDFREFANQFGKKPRSKGSNKAYAAFRKAIMQRDNFTCVDCRMVADPIEEADLLNVHHVVFVKHDKTRIFDQSNVITLCYTCHRKRHRSK